MAGVIFVIYLPTAEFEIKIRLGNQEKKNDKENSPTPSKKLMENGLQPILESDNAKPKELISNKQELLNSEVHRISLTSTMGTEISIPSFLHLHHPHIFTERKPSAVSQEPSETEYLPLEMVLEDLLYFYKISDFTWELTKNKTHFQICFACSTGESEDILRTLVDHGIGTSSHSSVSVLPCTLYYSDENRLKQTKIEGSDSDDSSNSLDISDNKGRSQKKDFLRSIKSRLTVAQVVDGVKANSILTFDYVLLLLLGSMIAALGLVENSPVIIVASMLVSPLMGPILAGTFGTVIEDKTLKKIGIINEIIGLALCVVTGYFFGLIASLFRRSWGTGPWPTEEMAARGQWRSLWAGALIAIPSGAGVALSVLGGNAGCLVGVAISASLLPPAVNAGILWALSTMITLESLSSEEYMDPPSGYHTIYSKNMVHETAISGIVSLSLTIINIFCIFITGILVLKIKEVAPRTNISATRRFWKQDIRVMRDYNKSIQGDPGEELAERVRKEWAALNANKTPDQIERKLSSVIENVCKDNTYLNVARYSIYSKPEQVEILIKYCIQLFLTKCTWNNESFKTDKGRPHWNSIFDLREPPPRTRNLSQVETSLRKLRKKSVLRHNSDAHVYRHAPPSVVVQAPVEKLSASPHHRFTVTESKDTE